MIRTDLNELLDMADYELKEFNISCKFSHTFLSSIKNEWNVRKTLSTSRMFSLCVVSKAVDEFEKIGVAPIKCVDAVPSLGIAGLMWSRLLGSKVSVTVNAIDDKLTRQHVEDNNLMKENVSVVSQDANALLHCGKFNFIYLEAFGTVVRYLEAACHAICHNGIICVVSTDLSTLYNKCPDRARRLYGGVAAKNEYAGELAIRLIIANVIRAACRYDKGVLVLLSHVDKSGAMVIVKVLKGSKHADMSLQSVTKLAHCRICNYRQLLPEKLYFSQNNNLKCVCMMEGIGDKNVAAPILMLGPVSSQPIFNTNFLVYLYKIHCSLDSESKLVTLLLNMILESMCFDSSTLENDWRNRLTKILESTKKEGPSPPKRGKIEDDLEDLLNDVGDVDFPAFYYTVQTHAVKGLNPCRINIILQELRDNGFRACKTVFNPTAIRTSATTSEFKKTIEKTSLTPS